MSESPKKDDSQKTTDVSKGGRPEHKPTEETRHMVSMFMLDGKPQSYISQFLKISEKTLRKHYQEELEFGKESQRVQLVGKAFEMAMAGNASMLQFLLKTKFGYSDKKDDFGDKPTLAQTHKDLPEHEKQKAHETVVELTYEEKKRIVENSLARKH